MYSGLFLLLTAIMLVGCGPQRGTLGAAAPDQSGHLPSASAAPQPGSLSVAESGPTPDREPNPAAARPSAFAKNSARRPAPAENLELLIPAGTQIRVRLAQTLSTKYTRPGGAFAATLDNAIVAGGRVIVPRGTPFTGAIVASKSSGLFGGRALLELRLLSFRMDGVTYPVASAPAAMVSGSQRNLTFLGGGPAMGAGIGALVGGGVGAAIGAGVGAAAGTTTAFITGKRNVRLPVETPLVFSLRSSVAVRRG
jgi:hypothetical protein